MPDDDIYTQSNYWYPYGVMSFKHTATESGGLVITSQLVRRCRTEHIAADVAMALRDKEIDMARSRRRKLQPSYSYTYAVIRL